MIKSIFLLFLTFSFAGHTSIWTVNKDHSEVLFQVPYLGVSELTGRFENFSGSLELSESGKEVRSVSVKIDADSIYTGNKMRDGHLRGSDFFQTKENPEITFQSESVSQDKQVFRATGPLALKGVKRIVTIEFTSTGSVKDTWGHENRFIKFRSKIKRSDFKISWNKTLGGEKVLVGDEVTFWGTFQVQPQSDKTPNSKHMIPDTQYIRSRDKEEAESGFSKKIRKLINGQ